jgi:hypothetical protein
MTHLEMIRANAEMAVANVRADLGVELSFDRNGVAWLDGYLNRLRGELSPSTAAGLVSVMGSFFGEAIVRAHGGTWVERSGSDWVVEVQRVYQVAVNVFTKVEKQLGGVEGESVLSLFDVCLLLAETGLTART